MRTCQFLIAILFVCFGLACGDEEADVCFSPSGIPSYVGRTTTTSPNFDRFSGCSAIAPTPPVGNPDVGLCVDACSELAVCGNADFDTCVESCEGNPDCAEAFRCFRDSSCEDQIDECLDELSACQ